MGFNKSDLAKFQRDLKKLASDEFERFCIEVLEELGQLLLKRVQENINNRTGNLRLSYAVTKVEKNGTMYCITIYSDAEYAPYVEFGHRRKAGYYIPEYGKCTTEGFTEGKFFLTEAEIATERDAPGILSDKLEEYLSKTFK